jgi:hypothetical protein
VSEAIEVNAGPEGQVKCTFNGDALELDMDKLCDALLAAGATTI